MAKKKFVVGCFNDENILFPAVKKVRLAGYKIHDVYTPFAVHGLDHAIGLRETSLHTAGFIYGITIPLLWAMIADVADYSEWKNNRRATAIIFSAMIFGLKLGLSLGGALSAWLLSIVGYDANVAQQTAGAVNGIKLLASVVPGLIFIGGAALLFGYSIDKNSELQIEKELKARRKIVLSNTTDDSK